MSMENLLLVELGIVHGCVARYLEEGDRETLIDDISESAERLSEFLKRMAKKDEQPEIP